MTNIETRSSATTVFLKNWQTYQEVVQHNYMFHSEISLAVKAALTGFKPGEKLRVLDLGCGDASMTLPLLSSERIATYLGCDLSKPALDIAEEQLYAHGVTPKLLCDDMLKVMKEQSADRADLIISSYALHHLTASQKQEILQAIARTLSPGGCFILIDIFREPKEDRSTYMRHYMDRLKATWIQLSHEAQDLILNHATEYDFPEHTTFYQALCEKNELGSGRRLAKHTWHEAWIFNRVKAIID